MCSSAVRPVRCAGSELVVLVFEQDVERGERSVTARDILLQLELVRFAQFAWHAVASAKAGRSRSPCARELVKDRFGEPPKPARESRALPGAGPTSASFCSSPRA